MVFISITISLDIHYTKYISLDQLQNNNTGVSYLYPHCSSLALTAIQSDWSQEVCIISFPLKNLSSNA